MAASGREVFAEENCRSRAYIWMRGLALTESELVVLLAIVKTAVFIHFLSHLGYSGCSVHEYIAISCCLSKLRSILCHVQIYMCVYIKLKTL